MPRSLGKSNDAAHTQSDREAALRLAIQLIKPFPWKPLKRVQYVFEYPQLHPPCFEYEDAWEHCDNIAHTYRSMLNAESKSIRLSSMRNDLSDLARSCRGLTRQIADLSEETQAFILGQLQFGQSRTVSDAENDLERGLRDWPEWWGSKPAKEVIASMSFGYGEEIDASPLIKVLGGLANHIDHLLLISKADYRLAARPDRGGKGSVYSLLHCSPRWYVVRECWTLFSSAKHLRPTTTSDGKLEQFIGALHEYATGEKIPGKAGLSAALKEYRRVATTMSDAQKALISVLRKDDLRTQEDIEEYWDLRFLQMRFNDSPHLNRVMTLYDKYKTARLTAEFGPQLVGLYSKSNSK